MKNSEIVSILKSSGFNVISFKRKKGTIIAKRSYSHKPNISFKELSDIIIESLPEVEIINSGDHYHSYVEGVIPGSDQDSFLWVEFKIKN